MGRESIGLRSDPHETGCRLTPGSLVVGFMVQLPSLPELRECLDHSTVRASFTLVKYSKLCRL